MFDIRINDFNGKGKHWLNIVFITDKNVFQWFGEYSNSPIQIDVSYAIKNSVVNGRYGVVNLVAEDDSEVSVFVHTII